MKNLIILFIIISPLFAFSQKQERIVNQSIYGYSFKADIDSSQVTQIALQIERLAGVEKVRGVYKNEKKGGQFLIYTSYEAVKGSEADEDPFNPSEVKELLIKNKLDPLNFKKIK